MKEDVEDKHESVKDELNQVRRNIIALINSHFDKLESRVEAEINAQSHRIALHSTNRLQTIDLLLEKEISHLGICSKDLNSSQFLSCAKLMETDLLPRCNDFHKKITQ